MADFESIQFEIERRVILFKPTTSMPDGSQLGYNDDPNLITVPSTPGEQLLYYCPNNTRFSQNDTSGNVLYEWYKKAQPNGWEKIRSGGIDSTGTSSPTWQINNLANGVVLQDSSGNLIVRAYDGSLGTLIVGNLQIGEMNGALIANNGIIYADPSARILRAVSGLLVGDDITNRFLVPHNLGTINHIVSVYDTTNDVIYPGITRDPSVDTIAFSSPLPTGTNYHIVILGF